MTALTATAVTIDPDTGAVLTVVGTYPVDPTPTGEVVPDCDGCQNLTVPGVRWLVSEHGQPGIEPGIERCDACARFPGDLEAAAAALAWLREHDPAAADGLTVLYEAHHDTPPPDSGQPYIAYGTDPWLGPEPSA